MPYVRMDDYFEFDVTDSVAMDSIIIIGDLVGITKFPYGTDTMPPTDKGLAYTKGEYRKKKASGAVAQGAPVYYDAENDVLTGTEGGTPRVGVCSRTAADDDPYVYFFINA